MRHDPLCICVRCLTPRGARPHREPNERPAPRPSTRCQVVRTFPEIAEELGTSTYNVQQTYESAMRKLRRRPGALAALLEVADLLAEERTGRECRGDSGRRVGPRRHSSSTPVGRGNIDVRAL
jgi:hypothetical protein